MVVMMTLVMVVMMMMMMHDDDGCDDDDASADINGSICTPFAGKASPPLKDPPHPSWLGLKYLKYVEY